jgi:hypothetical protein
LGPGVWAGNWRGDRFLHVGFGLFACRHFVAAIADESKWQRGTFAETNTTWGALMYHLKSYCEGNAPGPFFKQ